MKDFHELKVWQKAHELTWRSTRSQRVFRASAEETKYLFTGPVPPWMTSCFGAEPNA